MLESMGLCFLFDYVSLESIGLCFLFDYVSDQKTEGLVWLGLSVSYAHIIFPNLVMVY